MTDKTEGSGSFAGPERNQHLKRGRSQSLPKAILACAKFDGRHDIAFVQCVQHGAGPLVVVRVLRIEEHRILFNVLRVFMKAKSFMLRDGPATVLEI
jgi:hypothetical protein